MVICAEEANLLEKSGLRVLVSGQMRASIVWKSSEKCIISITFFIPRAYSCIYYYILFDLLRLRFSVLYNALFYILIFIHIERRISN